MVGVPGRSKGCSTCRQKRKGCDRNRPACHQCVGSGLVCPGYERELIWVNASSDAKTTITSSNIEPWQVRYVRQGGSCNQIALHDSLSRTAREQKYLGLFWSEFLPNGRSFSLQASELSTGGWTGVLTNLYGSELTLKYAAVALSASALGAQRDDPELRIKGLHAYNRAVREMGFALLHPKRRQSDGLLAAARFLELHEVLFGREGDGCPDKDAATGGWRQHNDGQLAMLLMRGPNGLKSSTAHQLFVDGRVNAIVVAIMRKKRCIFNHPDWKTKPWEGREKSLKDQLLDTMAEIPGLIEDYGMMYTSREHPMMRELCKSILCRCQSLASKLSQWQDSQGLNIQKFDYTINPSLIIPPQKDEEVGLLQLANIYWTSCMLVHLTWQFTLRFTSPAQSGVSLGDEREDSDQETHDGHAENDSVTREGSTKKDMKANPQIDPKNFAYKIAHSIHLLFEPSAGGYGGTAGLFPLGTALQYLLQVEPRNERSWELEALVSLFDKRFMGSSAGHFLVNLRAQYDGTRNICQDDRNQETQKETS